MANDFDGAPYVVTGLFADAEVIEVNTAIPGPRGPEGPEGPAGRDGQDSSGALAYVHTQAMPLSTWVITHPLNFIPNVTVVDSAGTEQEGSVQFSQHSITISFSGAFSGTAYLS